MRDLEYSGTVKVLDRIRQLAEGGVQIVHFGGGTLDDTPAKVREATKGAIDAGLGSDLTDSAGLPELRKIIAETVSARDGVHVDPRGVIVTVGAKNAILEAIQATVEPGEEIIVLDPSWPSYVPLVKLAGAIPKIVPMKKNKYFELDPDGIRSAVSTKTKMIIINSPHNPTGRVFTKNELTEVCDIAKRHDLLVLSDECYKDLVYDDKRHYCVASFPGMSDRTIVVYGFSKAYGMAGWRIGYAFAREDIITKMVIIQSNSVSCATSFAQKGAVAALREGEKHLIKVAKAYQRLRDITVDKLNAMKGISCEVPEGAFWVFPDISRVVARADDLVEYLLEKERIATTSCSAFGKAAPGHLRIIYKHDEKYLRDGLSKLKSAIESYSI